MGGGEGGDGYVGFDGLRGEGRGVSCVRAAVGRGWVEEEDGGYRLHHWDGGFLGFVDVVEVWVVVEEGLVCSCAGVGGEDFGAGCLEGWD